MTGMMAGAPPTAPGGMSQDALVKELVEKHGFGATQARDLTWPQMIDAVIEGRLMREHEAAQERSRLVNHGVDWRSDDPDATPPPDAQPGDMSNGKPLMFETVGAGMFDEATDEVEDLDPDALMAELSTIRDEEEQYIQQHGLLIKEPGTLNYIFDGHAGAGPSSSARWLSCTASLGASREFLETLTPNQQKLFANSNEAARQGTTAHAAAEVEALVVLGQMDPETAALTMLELAVMPETDGEAYDEEMGEYITEYVDLVKSYAQERGDENVLIEQRVSAAIPLTDLHKGEVYEIPGSVDCGVLPTPEHPTLVAADLKYGSGIWVGVDDNSQAMIYALAMLALMVDESGRLPEWLTEVVLHIVQPRIDGIKTATITVEALLDWRDEVLAPALTKALYGENEGATFVPSEGACQFCPARGGCAALAEDRMDKAADLFDVQIEAEAVGSAFPETSSLTDTRLGELLAQITGLVDLQKDLKAEAERRLYRGGSVPGFQLVNYTPPRKWKDGADQNLPFDSVPELWTQKMVTPTQAIKIAEANAEEWDIDSLTSMIDVPDKRPVVAKEGDRRKTWEGRPPEAMFDVESEEA